MNKKTQDMIVSIGIVMTICLLSFYGFVKFGVSYQDAITLTLVIIQLLLSLMFVFYAVQAYKAKDKQRAYSLFTGILSQVLIAALLLNTYFSSYLISGIILFISGIAGIIIYRFISRQQNDIPQEKRFHHIYAWSLVNIVWGIGNLLLGFYIVDLDVIVFSALASFIILAFYIFQDKILPKRTSSS